MAHITNPILRGFNPDPSICRVGNDFYLATSTFEWLPGIAIHHSRDMVHWDLTNHVLTKEDQIDLQGVHDSAGVWAPSLSFADGLFYMVYTMVRTRVGAYKDVHNYVITSPSMHGPWSTPIYLNSSGFDPSLFHDADGRKWVVNMQWDHRPHRPSFAGIILQEFDANQGKLVGPIHKLLEKDILIEGPNLYKHGDYYYLMLAEGGTGWNHGISMARSRYVTGPYELDPQPAVLTTRDHPDYPLQKAGHGELVASLDGQWYMAHLCSRPIGKDRRCMMGRETALQKVTWTHDGWLRLLDGGVLPALQVDIPEISDQSVNHKARCFVDEFESTTLSRAWSTLRVHADASWLSLTERRGYLRLRGRESCQSLFEQSLVAVRLTEPSCVVQTVLETNPQSFQQMAGLICWYDTKTHFFLRVTFDETQGKVLGIMLCDDGQYDELTATQIPVNDWERYHLRAVFSEGNLQFHASNDGQNWQAIGPQLDATKLSDDYGSGLHFTGAFVGLTAVDMDQQQLLADFAYFSLQDNTPANAVVSQAIKECGRDT